MSDAIQTPAGQLTAQRATVDDVQTVLMVVRAAAAWVAARGSDQWAYYLTDDAVGLVRYRVERHEVYLFRDAGQRAVGTLCLQWADTTYWPDDGADGLAGYVHQLAVDPASNGRGIGSALLGWAADHIRSAGRRRFRLDCLASNVDLCRYYERQGFHRAGTVAPNGPAAQRWEMDLGAR